MTASAPTCDRTALRKREIDLSDAISADVSQLNAMLQLTFGNQADGDLFNLTDRHRDNFFWACSDKAAAIQIHFRELDEIHTQQRQHENPPPARVPNPIGLLHEVLQHCWSSQALILGVEAIVQRHQDSPSAGAVLLLFGEARKWLTAVMRLVDEKTTRNPVHELSDSSVYAGQFLKTAGHMIGAVSADPLYGHPGTRGEDLSMVVNLLIAAQERATDMKGLLAEARKARDCRAAGGAGASCGFNFRSQELPCPESIAG